MRGMDVTQTKVIYMFDVLEQHELNLPCPDTTEYLRSAEHGLEYLVPGLWYLQNIEVLGVFV